MISIGVDILRFDRLSLSVDDPFFLAKVFSLQERANEKKGSQQEKVIYYSKLFSCKEAVFKALHINADELKNWREIEIELQDGEPPQAKLCPEFLTRLGGSKVQIQLSLSYEVDLVCAAALVIKEGVV